MKFRGLEQDPKKLHESVVVKPKFLQESSEAFKESTDAGSSRFLLPRIEAIHAGATRNNTRYPAEKLRGDEVLKSGVYSWTKPYPKPVIYNHDIETDATGRVEAAAFAEYTAAGRPGIIVVPRITDPKAIEGVLGGRLLTVSIGATTDSATCSVCGTDIINEGFCGHMKGETYDGQKAEWIVGNVWFDELSWVNVPADSDAMIVQQGQVGMAESFAYNGRELIDLSKKTTEWLVEKTSVLAEGFEPTNEEGVSSMTEEQIKALQAELATTKEALATVESEKEVLTAENEQLKKDVEETTAAKTDAETALTEKEAELVTAQESLSTKEAEVADLTTAKESLEAEKTALETSLEEEKEARTQAVEENANLSTEMHKILAERVVDLRVSLGKESDREEAITAYVGRTTESLNDSLADLLKETAVAPATPAPVREKLSVQNPAIATDGTEIQESTKMTAEDALMGLFGGNRKK